MNHMSCSRVMVLALAGLFVSGCAAYMERGLAKFPVESIIREHAEEAPFAFSGGGNGGPRGYARTFKASFELADSEEALLKALQDRASQTISSEGGLIDGVGSDSRSFQWTYHCTGVSSGMICIWGIPGDEKEYQIIGAIFQR